MYQALYRKYRPKTLSEISGQDVIVKIIQNSIQNNHINHAYLFAGPRGTGKTSIAKIFAKMVNCENLIEQGPCGHCVSCTQSNNSDIVEIDAASNNGVDEIRELRNKVSLVPSYSKYKVYIIDEVHMLTTGAFNALLKTLEEPPGHVIFILATTDPHKIPETILSRCQRLDFKKVSEESIVKRLKQIAEAEKIDVEELALKEIARLSDGGMRDSIGMLDQAVAYAEGKISAKDIHDINGTLTAETLKTLINVIITGEIDEVFKIVNKFNEEGKNFVKLTEEIITFMQNMLLFQKAPSFFKSIEKEYDLYKDVSQKTNSEDILGYILVLNKFLSEMKTTNNPKLLLELALIQIMNKEDMVNRVIHIDSTKEKQNEEKNNQEKIEIKPEVKIEEKIKTEPEAKEEQIEKKTEEKSEDKKDKPLMVPKKEKEDNKQLMELKNIRINNTLAKFSKQKMIAVKKELEKLNDYMLDTDINSFIEIILDGMLKAASDDNLIFVYKNERTAKLFNDNILNIEKAIHKALKYNYKVIATDINDWEQIKTEFNGKKKTYQYTEETKEMLESLNKKKKETEFNEFKDIIEYN